jgi:hypothetical protein
VYIYPDGAPDFREAVYVSSLYFDKVYVHPPAALVADILIALQHARTNGLLATDPVDYLMRLPNEIDAIKPLARAGIVDLEGPVKFVTSDSIRFATKSSILNLGMQRVSFDVFTESAQASRQTLLRACLIYS